MTDTLRTPEGRFAELPGFPWPARYVDVQGMRMAYLDAGPADADVVLCLRGEPTWSYLYRKMIPVFLEAGLRVVAPDWLGFGRSDKPANDVGYTWDLHHGSMLQLVDALALRDVTLVVQDWGGMLGLTLPVSPPELVKRLLILNTGLGVGTKPTDGFLAWRDYVANTPDFNVGELMAPAEPSPTPEEVASYDAPFPDARYKVGVRRFPALVPTDPDAPGVAVDRAAAWWATEFDGQAFMAIGTKDPVLGVPVMERMRQSIRAARSRCWSTPGTSCRNTASRSSVPHWPRGAAVKGWLAAAGLIGTGAFAARRGLARLPEPCPVTQQTPPFEPQPMPDLPEPVRCYLEVVAPELPRMTSAVITGRFSMLMKGLPLPGRYRFKHEIGVGYKHEMEITLFGRKVVQGIEPSSTGMPGSICPADSSRTNRRWTARRSRACGVSTSGCPRCWPGSGGRPATLRAPRCPSPGSSSR